MADNTIQQLQGFNPDLQDITRQRDLAKYLMQQGLGGNLQGQMIGNRYVGASPLEGVANMYSAYKGKQLAKEADTREAQLADALRKQTVQDIQDYGKAVKGAPEQTTYGAGEEGPTMNVTPAVAPDYEKGLSILMGSKSPQSQALAQALLADQLKTHVLPEGGTLVRGGFGGGAGQTVSGAPKQTTEQRDYQTAVSQGYKGNFLDYQKDIRNASANRTNVNIQNQLPFKEEVLKETGKSLVSNFNTLQNIPVQIKQLDKVADLAPKSFAGSGAEAKLSAAKFLNNNLGLNIAPEKVQNTEELRTVLFTNIMDNLKKMDASPSQMQQQVMQESLGNIGTDPKALPKVVNVYKEILIDKAKEHNRRVEEVTKGGMVFPYDIKVKVPSTPVGGKGVDTSNPLLRPSSGD